MKKIILVCLFLFFCMPVFAAKEYFIKTDTQYNLQLRKNLYDTINNYDNIYNFEILTKEFTCHNKNCYDISSLHYNKFTKTYTIDMIMDLMWCNAHQEYKSPYGDGYISHLIFETKFDDNKITTNCKGFVVGNVVVDYKNGKPASAHYDITSVHKGKPKTIDDIKEFEGIFLDKDTHTLIFKNLANSLKD